MAVVNYSSVLIGKEDHAQAIEILEAAEAENSKNHLIYNNLGWVYFKCGEFKKALYRHDKSIELAETNPLAYCNRGVLKYFVFDDSSGIDDLIKAELYGDHEAGVILKRVHSIYSN